MSDQSVPTAEQGPQTRTLAVRIHDDLRAQLDFIAQLTSRSVSDEIRVALEHWVERSKEDAQILERAESVRAEIEREAASRRSAIEAFFPSAARPKSGPQRRGGAEAP